MSLSPTTSIFDRDLPRGPANHSVLTPLDFLDRAATVYPDKPAVVHGTLQRSYAETYARCRRLASALKRRGIGVGDTVSVMLPNTPVMLEAHYGVPMSGAVLNAINIRLAAATIGLLLDHADARLALLDRAFTATDERLIGKAWA